MDSTKDLNDRPVSAIESNKENETEEAAGSQVTDVSDVTKQLSRSESAKENEVLETESEEQPVSIAESICLRILVVKLMLIYSFGMGSYEAFTFITF